ncbi:MAG: peptidoglycan-associated lipoprotein Pal [Proteobacteria bacterium]|nr:peptidoglycan-associated lipoprotein Pal [Pseudomonadota bacterium]
MRQYLIATAALGLLALAGCETTPDCKDSGYHDFENSDSKGGNVPGSAEDFRNSAKDTVYFDTAKSNVGAEGREAVKSQADWLAKWPSVNVMVEGHCDERGTREYNMALGERRAHAVKKSLVKHGVNKDRVETVSYGKERPVSKGHGEAEWKLDRRATTVVR